MPERVYLGDEVWETRLDNGEFELEIALSDNERAALTADAGKAGLTVSRLLKNRLLALPVYEAWGLLENNEKRIGSIREWATKDEAIRWARDHARKWRAPVNLYRVPYRKTGSAPWREQEMQFICRVKPT